MSRDKDTSRDDSSLDAMMGIIRDFMDEFYSKTMFRNTQASGARFAPSVIKFLFAFREPDDACSIGELRRNAGVKRSTMTDMVDRMEREGLAKRVNDKNDRRVIRVCLTKKGITMRGQFYIQRRKDLQRLFTLFNPSEADAFIHHLKEASIILKKIPVETDSLV